jgi:hypothetical protein
LSDEQTQRPADADNGGHEHVDLTRFNALNIAQAQVCQFCEPLLGHAFLVALTAHVGPKSLLLFEQLAGFRHARLG